MNWQWLSISYILFLSHPNLCFPCFDNLAFMFVQHFALLYHQEDSVILERRQSYNQRDLFSSKAYLADDKLCDSGAVVWPQ